MVLQKITPERLHAAASQAARKVLEAVAKELKVAGLPQQLLSCQYLGTAEEGAPLQCLTRVKFLWNFHGELCEGSVEQEIHAARALHVASGKGGLRLPSVGKLPLRVAVLPSVIIQKKLVPGMSKYEQVKVHGLAIAKEISCEQEKAFVVHGGRRQEVLKVAHVCGNAWLCHVGAILNPNGLVELDVTDEPVPKQPRGGPTYRLPNIQQGDLLQKLYAVGHFKAEVARATMEGRSIDLKVACDKFNVDVFTWKGLPKNVFVIWSHGSSECRAYEIAELPYKSIR